MDLPDYGDGDPGPEPESPAPLAAVAPAWLDIPLDDLSSLVFDLNEELADRMKQLEPLQRDISAMRAHLLAQMVETGTKIVAHDTLDIHIEEKKLRDIRVSELQQLLQLDAYRDDRDFRKAVDKFIFEHQPKPTIKTDLRYLRGVVKYGPAVAAIVAKGVVEIEPQRRLVMQPKPTHRAFKVVGPAPEETPAFESRGAGVL